MNESREEMVERINALAGRDEGGIIPPPADCPINREPMSWWESSLQHNALFRRLSGLK